VREALPILASDYASGWIPSGLPTTQECDHVSA
jgi:hypothetical protein